MAEDLDCNELAYNSVFNTGDRYIYFGGYGGIIRLSANDIEKNMDKAPVLISALSVNGEPQRPGKDYRDGKITLGHRQNTISISFALIASRCAGMTLLMITSPFVAAAATM